MPLQMDNAPCDQNIENDVISVLSPATLVKLPVSESWKDDVAAQLHRRIHQMLSLVGSTARIV